MDIILFAVPFFFILIGVELIAERVRGTSYYRLNDSITSLTTGTLSQLLNGMRLLIPFTFYVAVYQNFALFSLSANWLIWVLAFVAYDFCYYWRHRFGHEMNVMWAAHVVHHSSEEYNLTTALRQTSGSNIGFLVYLPLAVIGVEPAMLATVGALNLVYQYWVHTQHINQLGWMERVFVTPSNHRGHHAQNTVYIDKNYGGVFIVWDRLFGTYQAELVDDKPVFGIRGALASWNPVWANMQVFAQLWQDCLHTRNWWHKFTLWFRRTGWRPPDVVEAYPRHKVEDLDDFTKYQTNLSPATKLYAFLQYVVSAGLALVLLLNIDSLGAWQQLAIVSVITLAAVSNSAVLQNQAWAAALELLKYVLLVLGCLSFAVPHPLTIAVSLAALASGIIYYCGALQSNNAAEYPSNAQSY